MTLQYKGSTTVRQEILHSGVLTGENVNEWEALMVQRVVALESDGSGHVVTRAVPWNESPRVLAANLEAQKQVTYVLMEPIGRILLASTPSPPSTYSFPEHAVSAGASWEAMSQFPLPPGGQIAHVPFYYTLRDLSEYQGASVAVIDVQAPRNDWEVTLPDSADVATVSLETNGTILFDYVRGFMVRSEMQTMTAPRLGAQTVTTTTSTVQELIAVE